MRKTSMLLALSLTLFLTACADNVDENVQGTPTGGFKAEFDPGNGVVPFPTNLLFSGTTDGTLNIPVSDPPTSSDGPKVAMNALDGFSTVAPITTKFSMAIDPSTASINGNTVRLWEVSSDPLTKIVTGFLDELAFGVDYFATVSSTDTTGRTLAILPLKPLKPETTYLVILSKGLKAANGQNAVSTPTYQSARFSTAVFNSTTGNNLFPSLFTNEQAQALEPLRKLTHAQDLVMAEKEPDLPNKTVLAWAFSTQSVGKVLTDVQRLANLTGTTITSSITPQTPIGTTKTLNTLLAGAADIFVGTITLPYYLSTPSTTAPTAPLNTNWQGVGGSHLTRFNVTPVKTVDVTVPLLIAIPNLTTKPVGGWPVAIYQHGITGDRSQMLAIADALAGGGIAAVAIDLPLHGLPSTSGLYVAPDLTTDPANITGERTFDVDFVGQNPTTGGVISQGPDGTTDTSGRHFINLTSLLTSRDNIRQAVADLIGLTAEIPDIDFDGGGADFDPSRIFFIGHSLGGITGSVFLANEPNATHSVLAFPGGGVAKLLDGSVSIGPEISAGLAVAGIIKGTPDHESFFGAAQTVLDSADPINYAAATVLGRGIMMLEVVGDGAANLPDQVVPNHVGTLANGFTDAPTGTVPGPLSGTDPLSTEMGLLRVTNAIATAGPVGGATPWLRFTAGDHGSILDPTSSLLVTTTMQTATVGFLVGNGAGFAINGITNVGTVLE